jgi:hypothetical protein
MYACTTVIATVTWWRNHPHGAAAPGSANAALYVFSPSDTFFVSCAHLES